IEPEPSCRFHTRCPYATDLCGRLDPALVARPGVRPVACHAYAAAGELDVAADQLPRLDRIVP
ncbi:MAG: peptide ABC transporter ATP-binding protein, partial [Acidimicrobiia bacterium]|nr:peptide ABC transporter ATP-binding protein [Acidimicrobiia bacterium]